MSKFEELNARVPDHETDCGGCDLANLAYDAIRAVGVLEKEIESLKQELRKARNGEVFLSGDLREVALVAKKVLEWDALNATVWTPDNKQIKGIYADSHEAFRHLAESVLAKEVNS